MRSTVSELGWPFASGGVLLAAGWVVVYALRGPGIELPSSPAAAASLLVLAYALGQLARIAATAAAWGADAIWAADPFHERPAAELFDELADRRFSGEVRERVAEAFEATFGLPLVPIGRSDDEALRDHKAKRLEEALRLARARASSHPAYSAAEARTEGTRALAAALALASVASLGTAAHDFLFARAVAHAFSSFSLVALGAVFLVAALAALGRARQLSRRSAEDAFLMLLSRERDPAASFSPEKSV